MIIDEISTGPETDEPKTKECVYCGKLFNKKPHEGYRDWNSRKYCSVLCSNRHFNETKGRNPAKWQKTVCQYCGKEFEARKIHINRGQMKYCSVECSSEAIRKHEVRNFNNTNYYYHAPSGYYVSNDGMRLNRAVWEFYNGPIPEGYIVHHKDEDKTNNELENLELIEWGEHTRHHHSTGVPYGIVACKGCGKTVLRKQSEINRGQNKFCSRKCSNMHRGRNSDGTFNSGYDFRRASGSTS